MSLRPVLGPVRICPAPPSAPPGVALPTHEENAEESTGSGDHDAPPYVQDALAMDFASARDDQIFGPQPSRAADLPDPAGWAAHIAQAIVEVMHGARPATQVLRWTSPEVYAVIARRGALAARREAAARGAERRQDAATDHRPRRRTQVTRVLVGHPRPDVTEASVVLVDGSGVRALAIRLVSGYGRWVVKALQIG